MVRTLIFRSLPCVAKKSISSDSHTFGIDTISGHRSEAIVTKVDVGKDTTKSNYVELDPHEKVQDPSFKKGDVGAVCTLHPKVQNLVQFIFSKMNMPTTPALAFDSDNRLLEKPSQVALSSGELCHSHLSGSTTTPVQESPDVDWQFLALGLCETTPLDHESQEFKSLLTYFHQSQPGVPEADDQSRSEYGSLVVEDIFQLSPTVELAAFAPVEMGKAKDARRLLWHGSRSSNLVGILSQGLKIAPREAPRNNDRWGNGIYLADESRKAWQYCFPEQSDGTGFLLLYEAQIGYPVHEVEAEDRNAGEKVRQKGLLATVYKCWEGWGWVDAGDFNSKLAGVMIPSPSAARDTPGLIRRLRGHNEVCSYRNLLVSV
jgi:hypothetical protein